MTSKSCRILRICALRHVVLLHHATCVRLEMPREPRRGGRTWQEHVTTLHSRSNSCKGTVADRRFPPLLRFSSSFACSHIKVSLRKMLNLMLLPLTRCSEIGCFSGSRFCVPHPNLSWNLNLAGAKHGINHQKMPVRNTEFSTWVKINRADFTKRRSF
ncbi:uncharacterized protein LOC144996475 [Oryzias latipes]